MINTATARTLNRDCDTEQSPGNLWDILKVCKKSNAIDSMFISEGSLSSLSVWKGWIHNNNHLKTAFFSTSDFHSATVVQLTIWSIIVTPHSIGSELYNCVLQTKYLQVCFEMIQGKKRSRFQVYGKPYCNSWPI